MSFEETLIEVWRQSLQLDRRSVTIGSDVYPVVRTSKRGLLQVNLNYEGKDIRGIEQNPDTKSRWAAMARDGKKVMQFLSEGRYLAVVVDGEVHVYTRRKR